MLVFILKSAFIYISYWCSVNKLQSSGPALVKTFDTVFTNGLDFSQTKWKTVIVSFIDVQRNPPDDTLNEFAEIWYDSGPPVFHFSSHSWLNMPDLWPLTCSSMSTPYWLTCRRPLLQRLTVRCWACFLAGVSGVFGFEWADRVCRRTRHRSAFNKACAAVPCSPLPPCLSLQPTVQGQGHLP